jgi:hypothetical protein
MGEIKCPIAGCEKKWTVDANTLVSEITGDIREHFIKEHSKEELAQQLTCNFMIHVTSVALANQS